MYFVWDFLILMWFFLGGKTSWLGSGRDWEFQVDFPAAEPQEKPSPGPGVVPAQQLKPRFLCLGIESWLFLFHPVPGQEKNPLQNSNFTFSSCWYPKNILGGKKNSKCAALGGKNGFKGKFHLISHLREQNTRAKSSGQWNQGYFWTLYFHFSAPSSPFPPCRISLKWILVKWEIKFARAKGCRKSKDQMLEK